MTKLTKEKSAEIRKMLNDVFDALDEKGYDPVLQMIGYLISEEPTYITPNRNARNLIQKYDRDDIMIELLTGYLGK
ncbi:MAG: IreB family regulatory phosphoprotein [Lachnospiraceae bacterium]|nr:IreB family regulatory phosphoprotein [Lachnospiraceae bacterium]